MDGSQNELFELTEDDLDQLEKMVDPEIRHKWPQNAAIIIDIAASALRNDGIEHECATNLAGKSLWAIANYEGGRHFYLPRGDELKAFIRNRELYHAWQRGAKYDQLAAQSGLTLTRVLQIINEHAALWRRGHMPQLPGMENEES